MAILKIRDAEGNVQEILAIKGSDGKNYILTDADKQEIADIVAASFVAPTNTSSLTEEQIIALINANMPTSAEEVNY